MGIPGIQQALKTGRTETIRKEGIEQESADKDISTCGDPQLSVVLRQFPFEDLKRRTQKRGETEAKEEEKPEGDKSVKATKKIEDLANEFQEKNPELQTKSLLNLRSRLSSKDSSDTLLKKVLEYYPDHFLADQALEFLIVTSHGNLADRLKAAKEQLNKVYNKEINAGTNIAHQSREFAQKGIGAPTILRDLYRNVTQNSKEPAALFTELTTAFSFDKLRTVLAFIFHAAGDDLKSKGPSIEKGELANLLKEIKSMQAILGVYRFFKGRTKMMSSAFEREGLSLPPRINFEVLSKLFVKLLLESYPSTDKIYQLSNLLGIQDDLISETLIFTQMRDAIRNIDPQLFKSEQHRQEILKLFLDVLKEIDDKLDALDEVKES